MVFFVKVLALNEQCNLFVTTLRFKKKSKFVEVKIYLFSLHKNDKILNSKFLRTPSYGTGVDTHEPSTTSTAEGPTNLTVDPTGIVGRQTNLILVPTDTSTIHTGTYFVYKLIILFCVEYGQ